MIVKHTEPSLKSFPYSQEEHRLICELNHIDQRLRSKTDGRPHNELWRGAGRMSNEEDQYDRNKCNPIKDGASMPIYGTNMEYFSEICNQDIDDDSLFDPHNNFLGPTKPHLQHEGTHSNEVSSTRTKKREMSLLHNNSIPIKNSQPSAPSDSHSQVLKERNYIYKKQAQPCTQPTSKLALPPKNSKITTNKVTPLTSKSQERKTKKSSSREDNSQNQLKRTSSKQKYIMKQPIYEQRQSNQQEQNQIKFHTFEAYLEKTSCPQKKMEKNIKFKKQQPDKTSLQCTFKPTILKKSSQMAKSVKNVVERLSTSIHPKEEKRPYQPHNNRPALNKSRLEQLSQPRKLKTQGPQIIEQTPSFKPSLSKKSLEQMSHCTYNVATRNQLWLQQREQKIQKMKQEEQQQRRKRQNCTYSPSLCPYRGETDPRLSRFGRQGMVNYFERLSNVNKSGIKSKFDEGIEGKENRQNCINLSKQNFSTKEVKKQSYQEAVKKLHNRIMGLKI